MAEKTLEDMAAEAAAPKIAADLEPLRVPVGELTPHPENPRRGDVDALMESLRRFGQLRPIVATLDGVVVAGNHLLRAAEALGWDEVAAIRADLPESEARAYLLADNRLADLGTYDNEGLAGVLRSLGPEGVAGTGYEPSALDSILARLSPAPPAEFQRLEPADMDLGFQCPTCGYEAADAEAFRKREE